MAKLPFKTGCLIELSSYGSKNQSFVVCLLMELRSNVSNSNVDEDSTGCSIGCYLSKLNNPFSRLSIAQNGTVSFSSKFSSKTTMLTLDLQEENNIDAPGRDICVIRSACVKHKCKDSGSSSDMYGLIPCFENNEFQAGAVATSFCVRVIALNPYAQIQPPNQHPQQQAHATLAPNISTNLNSQSLSLSTLSHASSDSVAAVDTTCAAVAAPPSMSAANSSISTVAEGMGLSIAQKKLFRENGYLHLSQIIDCPVQSANGPTIRSNYIARVVYRINHALGTPHELTLGGNQSDSSLGKLGGMISNCKEIRQLIDPAYGNDNYPPDLAASMRTAGIVNAVGSIQNTDSNSCSRLSGSVSATASSDYYNSHIKLRRILSDVFGGEDNIPNVNAQGAQIACRFPENFNEVNCLRVTDNNSNSDSKSTSSRDVYGYFSQQYNARVLYPPLSLHDWHVDGLRQGARHSFSLLLGVCCSVVNTPYSGNLVLWPGSHTLIHQCYKNDYGGLNAQKLAGLVRARDQSSSSNSGDNHLLTTAEPQEMEQEPPQHHPKKVSEEREVSSSITESELLHENEPSDLPNLCPPGEVPLQLCNCQPGDVILLHPDTAHCGGPNYSQHQDAGGQIRIMIYFRLKSNGYGLIKPVDVDSCTDGATINIQSNSSKVKLNWTEICEHCKTDMYFDLPGFKVL